MFVAATQVACGGSERIVRDETISIERRLPSEDRTVAEVGVRDDAIVVVVERRLICQKGSYEDTVREEPRHGGGWLWGGAGTIAGGAAIASDKNGGAAGAFIIAAGVALVVVGAVKLGTPNVEETKTDPIFGDAQTCARQPIRGAFVSVGVGDENLAATSTDDAGKASLPIDEESWERAPLVVHVDLPHDKTVALRVSRDGSVEPVHEDF